MTPPQIRILNIKPGIMLFILAGTVPIILFFYNQAVVYFTAHTLTIDSSLARYFGAVYSLQHHWGAHYCIECTTVEAL